MFADVGTSVYYVPGILYGNVGSLAGFFVMLTMSVFVLLTLKYAEVTHRFPQGGGVVTVAAQAINHWVGALGGMFILVDYFLTAAISCLSGMLYLSVVVPALVPFTLEMTVGVLLLLGLLNWLGVSDIALLVTVFTHLSFTQFLALFPSMFAHQKLTLPALLVGFAGSFLAFSGLESISQLSPVMKTPRKKVAGIALPHFSILLAVVISIGVLIAAQGHIRVLGDLYAFGLLGAFTLTCVGLDIVRRRERKAARAAPRSPTRGLPWNDDAVPANEAPKDTTPAAQASASSLEGTGTRGLPEDGPAPSPYTRRMVLDLWHTCKFYLGLLTTALVVLAWTTNLVAKPMATIFGGSVTLLGMGIAFFTYARKKQQGHVPVPITHAAEHLPGSLLAVLVSDNEHNEAVIRSAIENAYGKPVTFLYLGRATTNRAPRLFELHDPYYDDETARKTFGRAEHLAQKAKIARRYVYRQQEPRSSGAQLFGRP